MHCVILAGGSGTRFWPFSRKDSPKQLLNIVGDKTMLQITIDRLRKLKSTSEIYIITKKELYKIMQSGGMTKEEFDTCYCDLDNENLILEGVMAAQKDFNIKSTPSFVINGNLVEGNKNIKEFRQIIDKILSE